MTVTVTATNDTSKRAVSAKIMHICLFVLSIILYAISGKAQAAEASNDIPSVTPILENLLHQIPIADLSNELQGMVSSMKETRCGNDLTGCYMAKSGDLQLYFFTSEEIQQTLLLVIDRTFAMPQLLNKDVQNALGDTALVSPIISISTTDYDLDLNKMPSELQKVVRDHYFNVNTLSFSSGIQLAARANLGGPFKITMETMGLKNKAMTLRAAIAIPIPLDFASGAGSGVAAANARAHNKAMKEAGAEALKPQAFVQFQFAPNTKLALAMPSIALTDATFFIDNSLTFGYKGNALFQGVEDKPVILQFQTPLSPEGAMDLLDFSFRMATPASFTMEDSARMMVSMQVADARLMQYGGGFIRNIDTFKDPLLTMLKPLSLIELQNPEPPPVYRFGDSSKPFPNDNKYFNFILYGPLVEGGPFLNAAGNMTILGQKMAWLNATAGQYGLQGMAGSDVTLKLGPLGKITFMMQSSIYINANEQSITMKGNVDGQQIRVNLTDTTLQVMVSASCVNPFEINTELAIESNTNLAQVFDSQPGVNVDPAKLTGCVGDALQAAYTKIANEYQHLGGYSAQEANAELDKAYQAAKDAAREAAQKSTSAASKTFSKVKNSFKGMGKKHHHHSSPPVDLTLTFSVFDWDFYYDDNPDVVAAGVDLAQHWKEFGLNEDRRGSKEFQALYYYNRYLDVQTRCVATTNADRRTCAIDHWVNIGMAQGRQGSPDFNVIDYLMRNPDLQQNIGILKYTEIVEHWFNNGRAEGRNGAPRSNAAGPVTGPVRVGGGNGGRDWTFNDITACYGNQHITGFDLYQDKHVRTIQFHYSGGGKGARTGKRNFNTSVNLKDGEYFVRVDFHSGDQIGGLTFHTNKGTVHGLFGSTNGSVNSSFIVPTGEKLGCVAGRGGDDIDELHFYSTGAR